MSPDTPSGTSSPAEHSWTPRLIFSLASIVLLLEMLTLSYLMISMSLPSISAHFHTAQGAWLLTVFLLVGAVSSPLLGKLGDLYGKRKVMLGCIAVSAVGSLLSAIAVNFAMMLVGRALAGLIAPCVFLGYSLIRDVFPPKTVGLAVSIATSGLGLIAIPAPFFAGWLIDNSGFRGIFWVLVAGSVLFGTMIAVSTEESSVRVRSRIDVLGAVLLGAGIGGVFIALSLGPSWGWSTTSTLVYLFGGLVLIIAWVVSAGVIREPLLELRVLRRRPILLITLSSACCYGCATTLAVLLPMMIMTPGALGLGYGFGVSAKGYALYQTPFGLMVVVGGAVVGMLMGRRVRPRPLLLLGALLLAAAYALVAFEHHDRVLLLIFSAMAGTGTGFAYGATPNLLIEAVPPQLQASTASVVNVAQSVMSAALPVIAFAVLNNSFIAQLPGGSHGAILYTEKGFQVAFLIGAVAGLIGAVLALALPRRIQQIAVSDAGEVEGTAPVVAH